MNNRTTDFLKRSPDDSKLKVSRSLPIRQGQPEAGGRSENGHYSPFSKLGQAVETLIVLPWTYKLTRKLIILTLIDNEYFLHRFYVKISVLNNSCSKSCGPPNQTAVSEIGLNKTSINHLYNFQREITFSLTKHSNTTGNLICYCQ